MFQNRFLISFVAVLLLATANADSNADLVNAKVERTIDLTTHLVRITNVITVENKATSGALKSYTFIVEPTQAKNLAFIGAQLQAEKSSDKDADKRKLAVSQVSSDPNKGTFYKIDFKNELAAGKSLTFEVEVVLIHSIKPYPAEITQSDRQLVLFKGNHYYYSLYSTKTQTTTVNLASDKTESYSQLKPTSKSDQAITYGPYENVKPFEQNEMAVHYENNTPFLVVSNLVRTIEISHWGNIAVEETIDLYHSGAELKGPFSRFDYMRRQGGAASVKSLRALLPPSARDVYYRDEIGNISTSNLRVPSKSMSAENVELEIRPRFPLFGGWKTHYTVGYNVPIYQYLFNSGNDYLLKMRLFDNLYDDQVIEQATVKIILPEHSTNLEFKAPFDVQRLPNEVHYTYLDIGGRPTIVLTKKNTVDNHIQDFQLKYKFSKIMILQEPLLVVGAFYLLFTIIIIVVRIDFTISGKSTEKKE
jgi:oligosaccharyltransferase complex subunit alpha (ribophorin I)